MKQQTMKAYITKYCLTDGIQEVDDAVQAKEFPTMISVPSLGVFANFHGEGKEWHRTREAALARAEAVRMRAISKTRSKLARLEAKRFV